jgi:hypothetical protein
VIHDLELGRDFFEGCVDVIEAALARLMVGAAATVSKGDGETERVFTFDGTSESQWPCQNIFRRE